MKKDKRLQKLIDQLIKESFLDGKVAESKVTRAIKLLKSLPSLQALLGMEEYLRKFKREERKHTLFIETFYPLSPSQLMKVKKIVGKRFKITKTLVSVNPQILGGFKLKIGDEVWDETTLEKINQLKEGISGRFSGSN